MLRMGNLSLTWILFPPIIHNIGLYRRRRRRRSSAIVHFIGGIFASHPRQFYGMLLEGTETAGRKDFLRTECLKKCIT